MLRLIVLKNNVLKNNVAFDCITIY